MSPAPYSNPIPSSTPASSSTPAALRCEEGQVESNGECIPIPAVSTSDPRSVYSSNTIYTKHEGYDFNPGTDFGAATYGMTVDECKQVCTDREGCDGFTTGGVGQHDSECWYKRKPTDGSSGLLAANNSVTTYMK